MTASPDVLIVGAGPTGLCLAYFLTRQGVTVRIIDARSSPAEASRAMGVQARTLELYRQFGIAEGAIALGTRTEQARFFVNGKQAVQFSLGDMGEGMSPYPYLLTLAQDVHERYLIQQLAAAGISVEWQTRLTGLRQDDDSVTASLAHSDRTEQAVVPWLVGCDGAGSTTRRSLDIGFGGGTSEGLFYVADVEVDAPSTEIYAGFGKSSVALMFPVRTEGTQRLIGFVPAEMREHTALEFEDVRGDAERLLPITVQGVNWFSTYRVHHRVADRFRVGRCFIAGDAGHIHSPAGGQGMNTGIGDAMNIAWKLAGVIHSRTSASVLDTYEPERIAFARLLVKSTDAAFLAISADTALASFLRTRLAPVVLRRVTGWRLTTRTMFRTISQIRIAYPDSALSQGRLGGLRAGERLPWVEEIDNHAHLTTLDWQLQIYGTAPQALQDAAAALGIGVVEVAWIDAMADAGLTREGAYLLRPDGHIALAAPARQAAERLTAYAAVHGLQATG